MGRQTNKRESICLWRLTQQLSNKICRSSSRFAHSLCDRFCAARGGRSTPCSCASGATVVEPQTTPEKKQRQDKNSHTDQKSFDARIRRPLRETPDQSKSARCSSNRFIRTHGVAVAVAVAVGVGVGLRSRRRRRINSPSCLYGHDLAV